MARRGTGASGGRRRLALLAGAFLATGCLTIPVKRPAADLAAAMEEARFAVAAYMGELNRYERGQYLEERLYDPRLPLATEEAGQRTPLGKPVFAPESVKARLDAMALVGAWAERLAQLASSDAPARAGDAGAQLGKELAGLGQRVAGLAGDPTAPDYRGPVATVVAALGEMWVAERREEALRAGIERAGPAVRQVIDLLEVDLVEAGQALRVSGEAERLALQVRWYNDHRARMADDLPARRALLDAVEATARRREALATFDPARITGALRDANEALLRLARAPRQPSSLDDWAAAMQGVSARIGAAAASARRLGTGKEQAP
jgi:hypothetical protein